MCEHDIAASLLKIIRSADSSACEFVRDTRHAVSAECSCLVKFVGVNASRTLSLMSIIELQMKLAMCVMDRDTRHIKCDVSAETRRALVMCVADAMMKWDADDSLLVVPHHYGLFSGIVIMADIGGNTYARVAVPMFIVMSLCRKLTKLNESRATNGARNNMIAKYACDLIALALTRDLNITAITCDHVIHSARVSVLGVIMHCLVGLHCSDRDLRPIWSALRKCNVRSVDVMNCILNLPSWAVAPCLCLKLYDPTCVYLSQLTHVWMTSIEIATELEIEEHDLRNVLSAHERWGVVYDAQSLIDLISSDDNKERYATLIAEVTEQITSHKTDAP